MTLDYCIPANIFLIISLIIVYLSTSGAFGIYKNKNTNYNDAIKELQRVIIIYFILIMICVYIHSIVAWIIAIFLLLPLVIH